MMSTETVREKLFDLLVSRLGDFTLDPLLVLALKERHVS